MLLRLPVRMAFMLLIFSVCALAVYHYRLILADALVPYFRWLVQLVDNRFEIASFQIIERKGESLYQLRLISHDPVTLYGQMLPGMDVSATTLVAHSLQHMMIFITAAAAALLFGNVKHRQRLLLLPIGLIVSLGLDIPFVLLGSVEGLFLEYLAPDQLKFSGPVMWEAFLTNGGRFAVAIGICLICFIHGRETDLTQQKMRCPPEQLPI